MKLIIENNGGIFAYFESERHHKKVEGKTRRGVKVNPLLLDDNCDLSQFGNSYMVINVKPSARKKRREKVR